MVTTPRPSSGARASRRAPTPARSSGSWPTCSPANPRPVDDFKKGRSAAKGALVGLVMKATQGKANPGLVNSILEEKLSKA